MKYFSNLLIILILLCLPLKSYSSSIEISTPGVNIGIGTASPTETLDVNGTIRTSTFKLKGTSPGTFYSVYGFQWDPNNGTGTSLNPTMIMQTNGNVGIGITTPGEKLEVSGTVFFSNLGNIDSIHDLNGTNFGAWYNTLTDSSLYYGGTTDRHVVPTSPIFTLGTDSGNVGIGTAVTSKYKLDVAGTVRLTGLSIPGNGIVNGYVWTASGATGLGTWAAASASGSGTVNSGTAGQLAYYATSTTAVSGTNTIFISGSNVGIGSVTPGMTLDVAGTLRATAMTVNGAVTITNSGVWNIQSNLGIGSTAPGRELDVVGTIRSSVLVAAAGTVVCVKADGSLGKCTTSITGVVCASCT